MKLPPYCYDWSGCRDRKTRTCGFAAGPGFSVSVLPLRITARREHRFDAPALPLSAAHYTKKAQIN